MWMWSLRCFITAVAVGLVVSSCTPRHTDDDPAVEQPIDRQPTVEHNPADYEVQFPRNDLECSDESLDQMREWVDAMEPHLSYPREYDCDGPPYPEGPERADEMLSIGDREGFLLVDPAVMEIFEQTWPEDRAQARSDAEGYLQRDLRMLEIEGIDRPEAIGLPAPRQMPFEQVEAVLELLAEYEAAGLSDGVPLIILLVSQHDHSALMPDDIEPIPPEARAQVDGLTERLCETSHDEVLEKLALNLKEIAEDCDENALSTYYRSVFPATPMGVDLPEFWRYCDCEVDIEFMLAAHHFDTWHDAFYPLSVLTVELSEDGEPIESSGDDTWQEVVDRMQPYHGEAVRLEGVDLSGANDVAQQQEDDVGRLEALDGQTIGDFVEEAPDDADGDADERDNLGKAGVGRASSDDSISPQVHRHQPETSPGLEREIIQRVVRQNRRMIQHCYERSLQHNAELEGEIVVEWLIGTDGDVVEASIADSEMDHQDTEECLVRRIETWTFPEPDGDEPVNVSYPFGFTAGQ